jgi:hypothetical protein
MFSCNYNGYGTAHQFTALWTLYRSYFKGINANIELQAVARISSAYCLPWLEKNFFLNSCLIFN